MAEVETLISVLNKDDVTVSEIINALPKRCAGEATLIAPVFLELKSDPPHDYLEEIGDDDQMTVDDLLTALGSLKVVHDRSHSPALKKAIMNLSNVVPELFTNPFYANRYFANLRDWLTNKEYSYAPLDGEQEFENLHDFRGGCASSW